MIANQKLNDSEGNQVALFPLYSFIITQRDDETYSHDPTQYLATDYQAYNYTPPIGVQRFAPYYAPADMVCVGMDKTNASICWRSVNKVRLANNSLNYLIILFYHDNNVPAGRYNIGQTILQGEVIGHTGTYGDGGSAVANHVHIETGYGENWDKVYASPSWGHINLSYALHNYDACWGNDIIDNGIPSYPDKYPWKVYEGGVIPPQPIPLEHRKKFPWFIYTRHRKIRYLTK